MTYLESPDDISWAIEVHGIPAETQIAILYGNEDAPNRIDCWFSQEPTYDQEPDFVWLWGGNTNGNGR